jgi:hypothetical protein
MRIVAIPLALLLAAPSLAPAQERPRPPPPSFRPEPAQADRPAQPSQAVDRADRPPPDGPGRPPPPPGPGRRWGPTPGYYAGPYWWGYGWGYGYEPLYPIYPVYPERRTLQDGGPARPLGATLRVTGSAGPRDSGAWGMALAMDGHHGGFDLAIDAFAPSRGGVMTGGLHGSGDAYGFGSAHVSFPIVSGPAFRLRLQAGGSWLMVPATPSVASSEAFGFDLGASGSLGLIGPLGLEGHARITPFPVRVVDLRAAVALRGGPFSLLAGYRVLDVEADSRAGPAARFEGPELGLGLIF